MSAIDISYCYRQLGFDETPFAITPDTDLFYPGSKHMTALKHLEFGLTSGGFTLLTGEVGLGKTLLCRQLLRNAPPGVRTAYIFNPPTDYDELLQSIYYDLTGNRLEGRSHAERLKIMHDALLEIANNGEKVAVILDEAHLFGPEELEGLRLLSNLETEKEKLLFLVLVGQPELDKTLARKRQRPLAQRISIRCKLAPFALKETMRYIAFRIEKTRRYGDLSFTKSAMAAIHYYSGGTPRRINQVCDRAMLATFSKGSEKIGLGATLVAAKEVMGRR